MKNSIEIKNITKKYDDKFSLGPINIQIPSGSIIGLIGENGAGKTTLIKSILNIIKVDQGEIIIHGSNEQKEEIGVVLDNMFFPEILTPKDIHSIMKDIYKTWDKDLYEHYLKKFQLPTNKPIKTLSKGMHKKLEIATALSHHPKLLILDEPTSGLDPIIRHEILDIFLDFIQKEDHTILISTHITTDLETIADQIIFLKDGKIALNEMKDEILDQYGILKCSPEKWNQIDKKDVIHFMKNKYNYEVLIKNKKQKKKKYPDFIIDNITLDDLMLLIVRGEEIC